jgi:hypothetical protein
MAPHEKQQDLTVKGESVEKTYGNYIANRYLVNRKYQRKLVWTLEEKRKFIDSILKGYPVPIILLAEVRKNERTVYEIIDGMQRLNALMGFIENEYAVNGQFFEIESMAQSKQRLDDTILEQREPKMDRDASVRIASYTVPVSVYEAGRENEIDEVFRRINSGGRQLSKQELRTAGATGYFAQAVRIISSKIRGDASFGDELLLNEMKKISITSKDLSTYGIDINEIFWVKHKVLTKEQVRESKDEEIIADILAYTLLGTSTSSRSEFLNDYYFGPQGSNKSAAARYNAVELEVQKNTVETVEQDFQRVIDVIKQILDVSGKTFDQVILGGNTTRAPRYFQVVFLALYKLVILENKEVIDFNGLVNFMDGSGNTIRIPTGGRWSANDRTAVIRGVAAGYEDYFQVVKTRNPATEKWITKLETILTSSYVEQNSYDFKQGFLLLKDSNVKFDDKAFEKIMKTLVGIANIRQGTTGYVIVGIADKKATATRIKALYDVTARKYDRFFITGLEHEASALGKSLDELYQLVVDKVRRSKVSDPLRSFIARNIKFVNYYEKIVFVFETTAQEKPSSYDGVYYTRYGNQLDAEAVDQAGLFDFFSRFSAGY